MPASLRRLGRAAGLRRTRTDDDDRRHPERLAVLEHVVGPRVLEVGCGPRKSSPDFIAIDLTPGGQRGAVGNAQGRLSQADVAASGDALPVATATFDSIVARHNLEHYVDIVGVLQEWARVVRPDGKLVVVVPDEDRYEGRTVLLDPTHFHSFNEALLSRLLPLVGWEPEVIAPCVPGWSLIAVARRSASTRPADRD